MQDVMIGEPVHRTAITTGNLPALKINSDSTIAIMHHDDSDTQQNIWKCPSPDK